VVALGFLTLPRRARVVNHLLEIEEPEEIVETRAE
jgi:hypothetical protein